MEVSALNTTALNALNSATTPTGTDLGVAMLSKQLDMTEVMGTQMVSAMENSVNPSLGGNLDISV